MAPGAGGSSLGIDRRNRCCIGISPPEVTEREHRKHRFCCARIHRSWRALGHALEKTESRKLRSKIFAWTMVGAFVAAMLAVTLGDRFLLDNFVTYAAPLAAIIFVTLGFLVPMLSRATLPVWVAAVPIVVALAHGVGLFGQGNVASGDLSLDDLAVATTTTTPAEIPTDASQDTVEASTGNLSLPVDISGSFTVSSGIATYSVPEILRGLSAQGVGESSVVSGSIIPGGEFSFNLDMLSFVSDQSRRDSTVRGWFADFPDATFTGESFSLPSTAVVGEVQTFEVAGDLTG